MAERKKPELLAPAGDRERLRMAVLYGADAVYLAGESFGMRSFAGNFSPEELPEAVRFAHAHGVKVHVTVNTMPRNGEVERLPAWLELLDGAGVDALILADLGAFSLAGRYAPSWRDAMLPTLPATCPPRPAWPTTRRQTPGSRRGRPA